MPVLLLGCLLAGIGTLFLIRSFWRWRANPQRPNTACGKCNYPVFGLSTTTCPECGADWRQVGLTKLNPQATLADGIILAVGAAITSLGLLLSGMALVDVVLTRMF